MGCNRDISVVRVASDGKILSYDIDLTDGGTTVRHRKYLMKVTESLPTFADREVVQTGADRDIADLRVMRPGADLRVMRPGAEGGLETSIAEAVTMPLSDQVGASASAGSGQLARLRPWGRN